MSSCPNKSHPAWKALVEQTGSEIEAYKEYINNDFSIPYTGVETNKQVAVYDRIQQDLPKEVADSITVLDEVPLDILGRPDLFFSIKNILIDNGITDEVLINWVGVNKNTIGHPKTITSVKQLNDIIENRLKELQKESKYAEFKINPLALESFNKWKKALEKYPPVFQEPMLKHAVRWLVNPNRRSRYVLQLSEIALTNAYGMVVNKPHELNRIGKLYDQEVLKTVSDAIDHEPSASGKGYWVHIPRTEKPKSRLDYETFDRFELNNDNYSKIDTYRKNGEKISKEEYGKATDLKKEEIKSQEVSSSDYKKNVELLRKLSPSTWCTASSMTDSYVQNYDNYLLIVDGVTVAGIEAYPEKNDSDSLVQEYKAQKQNYIDGQTDADLPIDESVIAKLDKKINEANNKTQKVKEVTSRANNGTASIDHLDDTIAFFEKHNLDLDNQTIKNAIDKRDRGAVDSDLIKERFIQDQELLEEQDYDRYDPYIGDYFYGLNDNNFQDYGPPDPDQGEYDALIQRIQNIDTVEEVLNEDQVPIFNFFISFREWLRADERVAIRAINYDSHNIVHIDPNVPFYNDIALRAVTLNPYVYTYLNDAAKNIPGLRDVYDAYMVGRNNIMEDDLPFSRTSNSLIQGYYDAKNDNVVVIASNTPVDEASKVGIHEVAHRGMLRMAKELGGVNELGKALFGAEKQLMQKLPELLKRTGHKNLESLMLDYGFTEDSNEGKIKLLMELSARWAETLVNKPKPSWWKELLQNIATWIKQFTGKTLTEDEVNDLVGGFVKYGSKTENTFQQKEGTETSTASPQTISMIKDFLKRIGVDIKPMQQIVVNGVKQDANGAALIMQKLIQVMEGKEASALPEEAMHFAVEIIKQTNPALYKTLLKEINNYAILKNVFADYATDPAYQTKDGKPDVIKLKEEAIAKVLADTIIKKTEGVIEKPENLQKTLNWWEKITEWLKGLFLKSGFDQAAMDIISGKSIGTANDIRAEIDAAFLQKNSDPQTTIYNKIKEVASRIKPKKVMVDGEEVEKYFIDGNMIDRRVTQLSKDWYSRQRDQKDLTKSEYQTTLADLKKEKGTLGHKYLELAFNMFIDENGFVRAVPLDEATALSKIPVAERAVFNVLKDNLKERINTINAEGDNKVRFMSEVTIYDPKRSIAGTVDFLAITPDGKTYVLDWKFIAIKTEKFKDIPWYNVTSWRVQMEQYKLILRSVYGVKANDFVQTRMIPIQAIYKGEDAKNNVLPKLDEVKIGDVTVKNIAEDFLLPLSLAEETTGTKKLDTLIGKLNAVYKKFSERRVLPSEKLDKNEQLNTLFQAIRHLQMKNDLRPLLRQAKILNIQINKIIDRYNNEFKGKNATSFTEQQINEFSADLITAQDSLRTYITLDVDLEFLFPKTLTEEDIALKNDLIATAGAARTLMNDVEGEDGVINEFAQEIVAKSESVNSLLSSEKIIKGFTRLFGSTSTLQNRSIQLLYKKANKAFYYSATDTLTENRKLLALKEAFDKWARGKGLNSKNYFSLIKKKGNNELIDEFNPEFFSILKKKIETKDFDWIRQNINVPEYNQALSKKLEEEIQRILDKPRVFDNPVDIAKMDLYNQTKNLADLPGEMIFEIREKQALYNTSTTESPGWLLYDLVNKHPAEKWMSKEWKELHAKDASGNYINKPALDFFNYIREKNEEYRDLGYIRRDSARVFLPFVRKSFAEKLVTKGQLRLGEQFFRSISIDEGDVGFGQIDPLTGKPIDVIPKYFTTAVEGEMSEDLFKTMAFYNESAIRYKYLKQIENQLQLISGVERNKKAIATSFFGKTDYVDDVLQYTPNNNENSKLYDDMMKSIVYGQKFLTSETFDQLLGKLGSWGETINKKLGISIFPEGLSQRQLSVNKILNSLNNTFQLSSLGLNLLSASSNFFGGNAQSIINSGKYFTKGDYLASELEIFTQRLNVPNQKKILAALEYFLPLTENYNREFAKKLSLSTMTQESLQDGLMFLMRKSDWNVQTANFLSFLKNSIVENGRVVNAREFLRGQPKYENIYAGTVQQRKTLENDFEEDVKKLIKDKGILEVSQIINNELVIPGVDQKSDSVIDFRRKVQSLTKDALGNLSEDDVRMINMSVYGKSFMVFKNWIPRLVDVRMGNLKYNSASDAYEWGRTRMVFRIIKQDLFKSIGNLRASLVANERGVEFMRDLYEKKKYDYERDTGKELDMTEAQFIELVRGNIKSQVIDLIFYASMLILVAGIKDLPDDEEDPAVKNQYRYLIKMADKFKDEISYFYDPTALLKTVSGNVFPAISLIENFRKGFGNFFVENWAIMEGDQETVDDVYVIKYLMKTFPFTNQMVGYLPMFYPELAKDLGIKMQKNYGIK